MKGKNALISVFDKTGIVEFAREWIALGGKIYSSGGTATRLRENGLEVTDVAILVGGKAILGHKVVTLSRELAAGLLADLNNPKEMKELAKLNIPVIDLVCVDCYPLKEAIVNPNCTLELVLDKTDIGGPTMLREGAKGRRIVLCDVNDRPKVIQWLKDGQPDEKEFINSLCAKAEAYVADYVLASAMYHGHGIYHGIIGEKIGDLRYGENPWQKSLGLFKTFGDNQDPLSIDKFTTIVGNHGHINWTDVDRGLQTITHIAAACHKNLSSQNKSFIAIGLKHGNCCGAAIAESEELALQKMLDGNLLSIFGGTVMTNFLITESLAQIIRNYHSDDTKRLLDVIIAPDVSDEALEVLKRKNDACKITINPALEYLGPDCLDKNILIRPVRGGFLAQENYSFILDLDSNDIQKFDMFEDLENHKLDLILAWAVNATSNSNTITLVKDGMLIGNGVGQQDRKECCELALKRAKEAGHYAEEAIVCSDSFFPFNDGPKVLIEAGVRIILTTSGSIKDKDTIAVCNQSNVCLIMIPNTIGRGFYGH